MRRREFITLMGGAAAWPLTAHAQQPAMPVVGFLRNSSRDDSVELLVAIRQGLKKSGYVEGKNLAIEYCFADNKLDRLPALAADLVRRQVAVIIAGGNAASLAAKAATRTIPVVFSTGDDPIQIGLVSSLSRPGGNVTGVSFLPTGTLAVKRLELLHELMPKVTTIAYLFNPNNPSLEQELREARKAADALGLQILVVSVGSERDLVPAFAHLAQGRAGSLLVGADSLFFSLSDRIVALATRQALPIMHYLREVTAAGGLMSYGASITDAYRQAGIYTGGILKGASPADLPIVLPTRFELVINLTTAKALGIDVPLSLMVRADEIID
jgi:putative ABC transport system substrate-binding protein